VANGRESVAVYGVSVGQFEAQGIPCHSDPIPETDKLKANPAHAYAAVPNVMRPVFFREEPFCLVWVACGPERMVVQGGRTAAAAMDRSRWSQFSNTT
jgi:hypothetical protein